MAKGVIEFATLLLGLLSGPHPVTLQVDSSVAAVEIRVDGALVAERTGPPWTLDVDFGPDLAPALLEAVALDASGAEMRRARQAINLPRAEAEATLALERDDRGVPVAARVSWQSVLGARPWAVRATLDGAPVAAIDPARIALPPLAADEFHWLQVELEFPGGGVARAQIDFGGAHTEEISRAITAVPLRLTGGKRLDPGELDGLLRAGGGALDVVAVEREGAELVIVRGEGAAEAVVRLDGTATEGTGTVMSSGGIGVSSLSDLRGPGATASASDLMRRALTLEEDVDLRLLLPVTRRSQAGSLSMELFPASPSISPQQGGLYWALTQDLVLPGMDGGQRLADAVAVAGLTAALGGHRRAVVLVLGSETAETSLYTAGQVRGYLRALGVPFEVWSFDPEAAAGSWGEPRDVSDFGKLRRAVTELGKSLDRQAVVWVEGSYLPREISVEPNRRVARLE